MIPDHDIGSRPFGNLFPSNFLPDIICLEDLRKAQNNNSPPRPPPPIKALW